MAVSNQYVEIKKVLDKFVTPKESWNPIEKALFTPEKFFTNYKKNLSSMLGLKIVSPPADHLVTDGETIEFGQSEMKIIHTPGHSRGSISLYCQNSHVAFTGDTLFAGSIGRIDLPSSSPKEMLSSLKQLMKLPDQTIIYPGHGDTTTIEKEKSVNPFL